MSKNKIKIDGQNYNNEIKKEENLWNKTAKNEFKSNPPDYFYYKQTLPYKIYRDVYVKKMLSRILPEDKVLELGCYNGWFSVEIARKGAHVHAFDLAKDAISIAKKYYKKIKIEEKLPGTISYFSGDLNFPKFKKNYYKVVVIRNVLHHLINLDELFYQLKLSLKKDGLILVDDALPCGKKEAFFTGILLFVLPTDIPYSQKFKRVFKKGNILKRTQGLVDACGASPFEGISEDKGLKYLKKNFKIKKFKTFATFIGTISSHIKTNENIKYFILKFFNIIDIFLIKIKLFKGTGYYLEAVKK